MRARYIAILFCNVRRNEGIHIVRADLLAICTFGGVEVFMAAFCTAVKHSGHLSLSFALWLKNNR